MEKESVIWKDREITELRHLEASFRCAAQFMKQIVESSSASLETPCFAFPYQKRLGGDTFFYLFRVKPKLLSLPYFSLDVGKLSKKDELDSVGWIDFEISNYLHGFLRNQYTEVRRANFFSIFSTVSVVRHGHDTYDLNKGIYVDPEYRRRGIGTSLVTGVRVVMSQFGIKTLIFDEINWRVIGNGKEKYTDGRDFYTASKMHMFDEIYEYRVYNKDYSTRAAIPTKESERWPYVFL